MKRGLLIVGLGFAFLVLVTGLGTFVTNYMPTMNTPHVQSAQAGPYTVTLRIDPNPPASGQPATFAVSIVQSASRQPVNRARVTLEGTQEDMGLTTSTIEAREQGPGTYAGRVNFSMSGSWQVQVAVAVPGQTTENAAFAVTSQ
jgi:hypothetical protein